MYVDGEDDGTTTVTTRARGRNMQSCTRHARMNRPWGPRTPKKDPCRPSASSGQPSSLSPLDVLHRPLSVWTPRPVSPPAQRIKQCCSVPPLAVLHQYQLPLHQVRPLALAPTVSELRAARRSPRNFLCGSSLASTGRPVRALASPAPYGTSAAPSLVSVQWARRLSERSALIWRHFAVGPPCSCARRLILPRAAESAGSPYHCVVTPARCWLHTPGVAPPRLVV